MFRYLSAVSDAKSGAPVAISPSIEDGAYIQSVMEAAMESDQSGTCVAVRDL
jgi:hypothetical protein